jgi:lysophospholipid acyltransferase (LPLAT)-like uncharacterized protein
MRVPVPPALVRWVGVPVVSLVAATWRVDRRHHERFAAFLASQGPRLLLLWHETLLPLLVSHRNHGVSIIVSEARDGRYLANFATRLGYGAIGGSSHRGQVKAMRGALRGLEAGIPIAVTPDGPKGPRRVIKPGALQALQAVGGRVMPVYADARPAVRVNSWDRFLVPLPFARVRIAYGEPFQVPSGPDGLADAVEHARSALAALEKEVAWPSAA